MTHDPSAVPDDAIAIIGMAGRFPGAANLAQFWANLASGTESVTRFSATELLANGTPQAVLDDPLHVPGSAVLADVELFDAAFFGIAPREAEITDPQHRIFLELAWEALEDSGYDAEAFEGEIGVYAGAGPSTYLMNCVLRRPDVVRSAGALALQLGNNKDYVPLRVSYKLQLRGPSVNVNTACSSSLVAVHLACQSLIDHQCDIALAGGVGIQIPQGQGYLYSANGILSPDGHCRAFDARAEGTISGNGAGIVVLKRYDEAVAARDTIRAVILGSAINNDGGTKVGFTAPSVSGQSRVIAEALAAAEVEPASLGYIEAHGTGTPLGDPIEVAALVEAFRGSPGHARCALGSVKTNIGHLDEAAGVAGLIKVVLSLQHGAIPPSLHFERPNPEIDFAHSPFYVPTRLIPWESDGARRAGVSSFGIGGTNAHAVLQQAPSRTDSAPPGRWEVLLLSARTNTALDSSTTRLAAHLRDNPDVVLADVAHTLRVGRKDFPYRRMLLCRDRDDALTGLEVGASSRLVTAHRAARGTQAAGRSVVFLFPGQGSQHLDMGLGLYRTELVFREALDGCADHLRAVSGLDLRAVLYPPATADRAAAQSRLDRTELAQPALFAVEYALARLLFSRGIRPRAMVGHSLGEYVAACLAGVFSWQDGLSLVALRGQLMQRMASGGMLAVDLSEAEVLPLLPPELALAAGNAPGRSVVAGPDAALSRLAAMLAGRSIPCRTLRTSHAFHSATMEPVMAPLAARLRQMTLTPPSIPYVSNVTGGWITAAEATDPEYWARQLRAPVRFSAGLGQLVDETDQVFVEVGPGNTLSGLVRRHRDCPHPALATMRHPMDSRDDAACLLETMGRLWLLGACRKLSVVGEDVQGWRVGLPTYPFERVRFWVDPPEQPAQPAVPQAGPDRPVEEWLYASRWRSLPAAPMAAAISGLCLVFRDGTGLGDRLAARWRQSGRRVVTVEAGPAFIEQGPAAYTIDPRRPEHYATLLEQVRAHGTTPRQVVHLWSVDPTEPDPGRRFEQAQARGFQSLLFLVQALGRLSMTDGLSLAAVSTHMQGVQGADLTAPEKATLLGVVRVAPLEYPGLACRSIDLLLPDDGHWGDACLEPLLTALDGGGSQASQDQPLILAIRRGELWQQDFVPYRPRADRSGPGFLRAGGTCLITGGLGSMGQAFARHLARVAQAQLILLGRNVVPPDFRPESDTALIARTAGGATAVLLDLERNPRLIGLLHGFCAGLILDYLTQGGIALHPGTTLALSDLHDRLKIRPAYTRMLDFLLAILMEQGAVSRAGSWLTILAGAPDLLHGRTRSRAAILLEYPRFAGVVTLLEHCVRQYPEVLAGTVPAVSVLYPDGTAALMDACRRDVPAYTADGAYLLAAAELIGDMARRTNGRILRILEVGGGGGGLTRAVLARLQGLEVDYTFTDLGSSLVRRAAQEAVANGVDFMQFAVLNIAQDPQAQGFDAGYDVVLGYNVVHAAPDAAAAAGHLRRLLAPGGLLMLVETTRLCCWDEMVWGLTEAWWHFTDTPLRAASPLLELDRWEALLRGAGFDAVTAHPGDASARHATDVGLVIARQPISPAESQRFDAARATVAAINDAGGKALMLRADMADPVSLRAALAAMRKRIGTLDGVIHAAGILGQGLIHNQTPETIQPVFAAKAAGLLQLEALCAEAAMAPAALVLCASMASLRPILGQVDYCAANAFLDAYAASRSATGVRVVSIGWGFWQELGMIGQARLPEAAKQQIVDDIRDRGRTDAGIRVFRRIIDDLSTPHIVVAPDGLELPREPAGAATVPRAKEPRSQTWPRPLTWPEGHPWFEASLAEAPDTEAPNTEEPNTQAYVSRLDSRHWVLDEHRPFGEAVLPGTGFLELARAALDTHGVGRPIRFRDVYFLAPLVIGEGETKEVRTLLTACGVAGFEFVIVSRVTAGADAWLEHARGEIGYLTGEPPATVDLAALAERCAADIAIDGNHPFAERVRRFTPHWRCFERLRLGPRQGLATLRLAPELAAETASMALHPALADVATGFLAMVDEFEAGVPFGYRELRVWQPLPPSLQSHARAAPDAGPRERSYDVTVTDETGQVLLEVFGYRLREPVARPRVTATRPGNFHAVIDHPGSLATLRLRPDLRRQPSQGEVEIEVAAAGVNFIEVLYALGMLPEPPGGEVRFGLECAGVISAVGDGVEGFCRGDAVFGFAPGSFGRFAITDAATIASLPPHLSPTEAATLPAVFTTAYYALLTRARLRRGERVLIHAAAGGVGLAAVNIAQWRGAEVLATAGSPEKRDYLRNLGIRHVWDSRTLDFVAGVRDATAGRGVDVVLNSLGGEFIPASLGVLGRYGRFLELGKRDILGDGELPLATFANHLSFIALDVGTDLPEFPQVWRQVVRAIGRQAFRPLRHQVFPVAALSEAFAHMAQARHIGKVVVQVAGIDLNDLTGAAPHRAPGGRSLGDIIGRGARRAVAAAWRPAVAPMAASAAARPDAGSAPRHARPALVTQHRQPSAPVETKVAAVWEELLGICGIGADDNFFELNGDSLLAAQVTSRLYGEFQVKLPLSSLFENPTIAALAARVEQQREGEALKLRASEGAVTPEITEAIRRRKAATLEQHRPAPADGIPRLPVQDSYELSPAQRRLWVLAQFPGAAAAYNIPLHQMLEGPLDLVALESALTRLVERHAVLRTRFVVVDGEPRQVIQPTQAISIDYRDLTNAEDAEVQARQLGHDDAVRPFDLHRGPLLRVTLLRLAVERHLLLFTIAHIVADGVSLSIIARDLSRLYQAACIGGPDGLPRLEFGYADFAAWQNRQLGGSAMDAHRGYWLHRLSGELPVIALPTDHPRPPLQGFNGRELSITLPLPRLTSLQTFCRERNASLFMMLHATLKLLLHAYTDQEDIIVGCAIAARDQPGLEDQVGPYLNTLALRSRIRPDESFETFFSRIVAETRQDYDHQGYPFDQLVDELNISRDLSRSPLFDVMLILQNQDEPGLDLGPVRVTPAFEHPRTSKFDLTFTFKATARGLVAGIEYNTDLFESASVQDMAGVFTALVEGCLATPECPIAQLPRMTKEQERTLLARGRGPELDLPSGGVFDLIVSQAHRTPDRCAVSDDDAAFSYAALISRAEAYAARLQRAGVRPGDRVGLMLERSADVPAAILGVLRAGAAYVPIDPAFPPERIAYIAADAKLRVLLTHAALRGQWPADVPTILVDEPFFPMERASPVASDPRNCAYIVYTSGSTGRPKGARVSHRSMVNFLLAMQRELAMRADASLLAVTTISFDIVVLELFLPLTVGARVVMCDRLTAADGRALARRLAASNADWMQATPTTWRMLLDAGWTGKTDLHVLSGGEALTPQLAAALLSITARLWNLYGPTETTVWSSCGELEPATWTDPQPICLGHPIANTQLYILDDRCRLVPPGGVGELCIAGEGVAMDYWQRPDLTAERFLTATAADPWQGRLYRTGDRVRWGPQQRLEYHGRQDGQIKLHGHRIELAEIEAVLASHPQVRQAVVDLRAGARLIAWYIGTADLAQSTLHTHLRDRLPGYMIPDRLIPVAAFPLTANNKVDRLSLFEGDPSVPADDSLAPPETQWEQTIARLWQDVLRVPHVGRSSHFFELGGHSLRAAAFAARLFDATGVRLDLVDVFHQPTLAGVARLAEGYAAGQANPAATILPATAEEVAMLSEP
jgi:amino acid adenylation domain-containing protein